MKTIINIYSVKGIEIILNLRNYERVKTMQRAPARGETMERAPARGETMERAPARGETMERAPARGETTLLQNFNSERTKATKKKETSFLTSNL